MHVNQKSWECWAIHLQSNLLLHCYNNSPSILQNPQYDIKDSTATLHSGITQTAAYYPYDPSLGQYQYDR